MAIFETVLKSDLKKPVQVKQLSGNLFSGDNQGNKITVEVMDNGSPATLSGGVTGYVIREDNSTVIISSGTLSGNKASIVLREEAYNVVGRVSIVVKVGTTTVGACTAYVYRTSTDTLVDPTGAIPSIQELLAKISACEQATADANKVANLTVSAEAATGSTPDAVLSETGSPAHKHITFKLVKGDKGDKGNTGATPQLSIGTVTTLQPSQDATVTITGTDEEPVLNFGIPQGASGNETIDDTAGLGDTDLVYSADKVRKELDTKAPVVDVPLTTPASVQSFPDGADGLPMALTVGIEPVQDLHGYDHPWPAGGGVNIWKPITGSNNGITFSENSDGTVHAQGTFNANSWTYLIMDHSMEDLGLSVGDTITIYSNVLGSVEFFDGNGSRILLRQSRGTFDTVTVPEGTVTVRKVQYAIDASSGIAGTNININIKFLLAKGTVNAWTTYSNICPISGWTGAKVTRTGKNLFDPSILLTKNTWSESNGVYSGHSNPINNMEFITELFPYEGQITFSLDCKVDTGRAGYIYVSYSDGTLGYKEITGTEWNHRTYTTVSGKTITRIHFGVSNNYAMQIKNIQFEFGAIETAFDGYAVQSIPITFPTSAGTVYGGTLTVNKDGSGELVVDRANVDLGSLTWTYYAGYNGFYTTGLGQNINTKPATETHGAITSMYSEVSDQAFNSVSTNGVFAIAHVNATDNSYFKIRNTAYSDASVFKTAMYGVKLVYPLATPVTYPLTPGQVKTLLGVNNIWADTGNILSVTYPADTKLYIDKKFAELSAAITALGT